MRCGQSTSPTPPARPLAARSTSRTARNSRAAIKRADGDAEKIDLGGAAAALCIAATGANPVRPHMLAINPSRRTRSSRLSRAATCSSWMRRRRMPVDCIRTSIGAGGARQVAHAPSVSRRDATSRSRTRTASCSSASTRTTRPTPSCMNTAATFNLATCTTPNGSPCQVPVSGRTMHRSVRSRGDKPLHVRHAARRRPVRRRQPGDADADRRRVRHRHRASATAAWARRWGKMYIDSGGGPPTNLIRRTSTRSR